MHIYVCSPSSYLESTKQDLEIAKKHLESFGHTVTYSKNMFARSGNTAGTIEQRVADLHKGFQNDKYDLILASIGGFNSNEILPYIDYSLIKNNPKPFCGFSDNTTLCINLYQKAQIRTIYGLCFEYLRFTQDPKDLKHFNDALEANSDYYDSIVDRIINGTKVIKSGRMQGKLVGGNLSVIDWLSGTEFALEVPQGSVLFIEDDAGSSGYHWQMYLRKLEMLGYFERINGLIVGRTPFTKFKEGAEMQDILHLVFDKYDFPVIYDSNFGHLRDNTMNNIEMGLEIDVKV